MKSMPTDDAAAVPVWTALFERDIPRAHAALASASPRLSPGLRTRLQAYVNLFEGDFGACVDILAAIPPWRLTYLDRRALLAVVEHGQALEDHDRVAASIEFLARCGEMSQVARLLEQALARYGETAALAGLALAAGLALSADASGTVRQARLHLQAQRHSPLIFQTLGRALLALGQPAQALQALELGARLVPDDPHSRYLRGLALDALGRRDEALSILLHGPKQDEAHPLHALTTARLLRRQGREAEAAACLRKTDDFLPLCALLLALTPKPHACAPDPVELAQALALPCRTSLEAERYAPEFLAHLDLQGTAALRPATLAQVRARLVALFPGLGTARVVRGAGPLGSLRRLGIHLPANTPPLFEELVAHLRARTGAACDCVLIHGGVSLGEARLEGLGVREFLVPGVSAPMLTRIVGELALDALVFVNPLDHVAGFALTLARLAALQVIVDPSGLLGGATIDAHCRPTPAGWHWTHDAPCSVYDDSPPAITRIGLSGAFRAPLTLAELANHSGGAVHILREAQRWTIAPVPELGLDSAQPDTPVPMHAPAAGHVRLRDVQVWNGETAFWHPASDQIAHEASFHHDRTRIASVSRVNRLLAQMLTAELDHAFLFHPLPPTVCLDRAIVVRSKASFNYFHWLFEGLAALESVLDDPALADWPLLIDENLHANLEEALRRVAGAHRRILRQPQGAPVLLKEAVAGFSGHRIPYTLHPGAAFEAGDYVFCPQTLDFLRGRLMAGLPPAQGQRRLFLRRRGGYRHLLNHDEIESLFVQAGFEVVDTGTMDLVTQMRTFAEASHIAGPTGAAFSNLLFAPRGARVLLFTNAATGHHFFSNLATSLGLAMTVIHGRTAGDSHAEAHQSDYALPLEPVADALAASLAAHAH